MKTYQQTAIVTEARKYVCSMLDELNNHPYHNLDHTLGVYLRAKYLCECEGVHDEEKEDVLLAALFHDTGFVRSYRKNETLGAKIAHEWLTNKHHPIERIERIERIILATTFPDSSEGLFHDPEDLLESIIQDSDMDNLGRKDTFTLSAAIYDEIRCFGKSKLSLLEYLEMDRDIFMQFHFHTHTARVERNFQKNQNLLLLEESIARERRLRESEK